MGIGLTNPFFKSLSLTFSGKMPSANSKIGSGTVIELLTMEMRLSCLNFSTSSGSFTLTNLLSDTIVSSSSMKSGGKVVLVEFTDLNN